MFDPTKPVRFRDPADTRTVEIVRTGMKFCCGESILSVATDLNGVCEEFLHHEDGRYQGGTECKYDLINQPEKISGWANFYRDRSGVYFCLYPSAEAAREAKFDGCQAIKYIETEVGEGL